MVPETVAVAVLGRTAVGLDAGRVGARVDLVEEAVLVAVGIRRRLGLGLAMEEGDAQARECLEVMLDGALLGRLGRQQVAAVDAQRDPLVEVELEARAVVADGVDVLAEHVVG